MPTDPIGIKRYPNRRFYASHTSSYISLPEIEEIVRSGGTVEIVDSQTGEDLTASVLMQILAERHPEKIALFPTAMLHSILRANDMMGEFLRDYFRNSLTYLDYFQRHGASRAGRQPMHWMKAWLENWSKASTGSARPTKAMFDRPGTGDSDPMAARIAKLERRIVELEEKKAVRK